MNPMITKAIQTHFRYTIYASIVLNAYSLSLNKINMKYISGKTIIAGSAIKETVNHEKTMLSPKEKYSLNTSLPR
jgi:hypothetical protein